MGVSLQVIYKKFNIDCPLQNTLQNSTNCTVQQCCEAKLFTINPQVGMKTFSHCLPDCHVYFNFIVSTTDLYPVLFMFL